MVSKLQSIADFKKALFVSGYTYDHLLRDGALEEGINFLQKPYSIHNLLKSIRSILDTKD